MKRLRLAQRRGMAALFGGSLAAYACAQQLAVPAPETPQAAPSDETTLATPGVAENVEATAIDVVEPPRLEEPVLSPGLLSKRAEAQARILGRGNEIEDELGQRRPPTPVPTDDEGNPVLPDGNSLGSFVTLENPTALEPFYLALAKLEQGLIEGGKLRVLAYGASHTEGDMMTGYLRHYLQSRFGYGGQGFLQFAQINRYYRTLDTKVESNGFKIEHAQRKDAPEHGRFGLLGAAAIGRSSYAAASVEPSERTSEGFLGNRVELYYMKEPNGGSFRFEVDGKQVAKIATHAATPEAGYFEAVVPEAWSSLRIRPSGNGTVRFFGGTLETDQPGIVIDTLGINGTRAANMLLWDEALWAEHAQRRNPQLITLAYGTNEAVDSGQAIETYAANLTRVLERIQRALPGVSCMLIGPGDFPKEVSGGYIPRPRLLDIVDTQRKLAFEHGCAFFDTLTFMGGEGSMQRWVKALPPLGSPDHIHLTARGYVRWGMTIGDALMLSYDAPNEYDRRQASGASEASGAL